MIDLSDNNVDTFKIKSINVKQQNESECGCCLALHMYLACTPSLIEDFTFHLNLLENIEDLSQKCCTWLFSILHDHNRIKEFPGFINQYTHDIDMYHNASSDLNQKKKII